MIWHRNNTVLSIVEAAVCRQLISARRPSRDSRYAAFLCTLCAYTLFTHMCYNRYPPHVDSNILYSTPLLALLFGCVCHRHTGDRLYTQPKQTWRLPDIPRHLRISNRPLPQPPPPPYIYRISMPIPRSPGSLP